MIHKDHIDHYDQSMEQLAKDLGDLKYDALSQFLKLLSNKIQEDGQKDQVRGRVKLAKELSIDFNHTPESCIFAPDQTKVVGGRTVRVLAWYDNEWGFSCRMADVAATMGRLL